VVDKPLLLAIDCDDTLLTEEMVIPESAIIAIAAARKSGVRVVIATGRMYCSVAPYVRTAGLDGPVIAYNGGLVRDLEGRTWFHQPVPVAEAHELIGLAEEYDLALNLYVDDRLYVRKWDDHAEYYVSIAQVAAHVAPDLRKILAQAPTKMLIVDTPAAVELWRARLRDRYGARLAISRSKPRFIEIMAPGISKAVALAHVATSLGIKRGQVMAIGDSLNDLEMLRWAGISVAVGNADPEVKARVDYVTARHDADGIAQAIQRFILD